MPHLRPLLLLTVLWLVETASGQAPSPVGRVQGRLVDASQGRPLAGAAVSLILHDARGDALRGSAESGSDGRFSLDAGITTGTVTLRVVRPGGGAFALPLASTPAGEGLLLGDVLVPPCGALDVTVALPDVESSSAEVRAFPAYPDGHLDPLRGIPLATAPVDPATGAARLLLAPGAYVLMLTDGFRSFQPLVLPWNMPRGGARVGTLLPREGFPFAADLSWAPETPGTADIEIGSGAWPLEGGGEIMLRFRPPVSSFDGGLALRLQHLPAGRVRVHVRAGVLAATLEGGVGMAVHRWRVGRGAAVVLRVLDAASGRDVKGGRVLVDGRPGRTAGLRRIFDGLAPGWHELFVSVPGFETVEGRRFFLAEEGVKRMIDVPLEPLARVAGQVKLAPGKPAKGAWILLTGGSEGAGAGARVLGRSDEQGRFRLGVPSKSVGDLLVRHPRGFARAPDWLAASPGGSERWVPRLAPWSTANITCQDAVGAPLAGVTVWLLGGETLGRRAWGPPDATKILRPLARFAVTDAKGHATFEELPTGVFRLGLVRDTAPWELHGTVEAGAPGSVISERLRLVPEIAGPRSIPWEGFWRAVWTDRPGSSSDLGRLDPALAAEATVVLHPGQRLVFRDVPDLADPPTPDLAAYAGAGESWWEAEQLRAAKLPKHLAPSSAWGEVRGTVLRGRDALGGQGIDLVAYPVRGAPGRTPRRLDHDPVSGEFFAVLPRGHWMIFAKAPQSAPAWVGPFALGVDAESLYVRRNVYLVPGGGAEGRLRGRGAGAFLRSDEEIGWDQAVEDWLRPFVLRRKTVGTDARGGFRWRDLPPGEVRIVARRGDLGRLSVGSGATVDLGTLAVASGGDAEVPRVLGEDLVLEAPFRPVSFLSPAPRWGRFLRERSLPLDADPWPRRRVLSERGRWGAWRDGVEPRAFGSWKTVRFRLRRDGRPFVDARLRLRPLDGGAYAYHRDGWDLVTDARGRSEIRVPPGTWRLETEFLGREGRLYGVSETRLIAPPGLETWDLDVVTAPLRIRVRDAAGRRPLPGAFVRVSRGGAPSGILETVASRRSLDVAHGWTNAKGEVTLTDMPLGTYRLEVSHPGLGRSTLQDVTLRRPRRTESVSLDLGASASVVVSLTDDEGRGIQGAEVLLLDPEGHRIAAERLFLTDEEGRAALHGLSPGEYQVIAQGPGRPAQWVGDVNLNPGGTAWVESGLDRGGAIQVICRSLGGRPLEGVVLRFESEAGPWRALPAGALDIDELPRRTGADGVLVRETFPYGRCTIRAELPGFRVRTVETEVRPGERTVEVIVLTPG